MKTCKTCLHWKAPDEMENYRVDRMCHPVDPDTFEPMDRRFETRLCKMPTQTYFESPVERNGFGLTDGSTYYAALVTAEDFGCVRHEAVDFRRTDDGYARLYK